MNDICLALKLICKDFFNNQFWLTKIVISLFSLKMNVVMVWLWVQFSSYQAPPPFFKIPGFNPDISKKQKGAVYKLIIQNSSHQPLKHKEFVVPLKTFDDEDSTSELNHPTQSVKKKY